MQQTVIRMAKRYKNLDIRMYSGSHEGTIWHVR